MRKKTVLLVATLLVACGRAPQIGHGDKLNTFDVVDTAAGAAASRAATAEPRIAYSYTVTYAFDRRTVGEVQGRQLALCRQLGTARCLVVNRRSASRGRTTTS